MSTRRGGEGGGGRTWHGRTSLHLVLPAWQAVQALRTEGALAGAEQVSTGNGGAWAGAKQGTRTLTAPVGGRGGGPAGAWLVGLLAEVGGELLVVLLQLLGVDRRRSPVLGRGGGL